MAVFPGQIELFAFAGRVFACVMSLELKMLNVERKTSPHRLWLMVYRPTTVNDLPSGSRVFVFLFFEKNTKFNQPPAGFFVYDLAPIVDLILC
jgi:hypothetical protein